MASLCRDTETAWQALGHAGYQLKEAEKGNVQFRRSLYVAKSIKKGETLNAENVRSVRPGFGLAPKHYDAVIGTVAACDLAPGTALSWDMITKTR